MEDRIGEKLGLNEIEKLIKKDALKDKNNKFKICPNCFNKILKKDFTNHLVINHFHEANEVPKLKKISECFIKNTKKIEKNLEIIEEILNLIVELKVSIKKVKNKNWYYRYKQDIRKLKKLLKYKKDANNNRDEEI